MRKILLASTALIAFAGAAHAESPIQVTLGGSVDFQAALVQESTKDEAAATSQRRGDFKTDYEITIAAEGKSASGIEYGALINLDNDSVRDDAEATMDMTYVWMSGEFGKVMMGDHHGASSLFVYAPSVGKGQFNGYFDDFLNSDGTVRSIAMEPTVFSDTEDYTKVTYYTPKVGNEDHKVQLGVSFTPSMDAGSSVTGYDAANSYKNMVELAAQYNGTFGAVNVVATPLVLIAEGTGTSRDYTIWGFGTQAAYAGFTAGASYANGGRANTVIGQDRHQDVWTVGLKYEFDKVELAANYMTGEGYYTLGGTSTYVDSYDALGLGATYTWFPGMRTAADAVFFNQNRADTARNNRGHVLMLSQKMSF